MSTCQFLVLRAITWFLSLYASFFQLRCFKCNESKKDSLWGFQIQYFPFIINADSLKSPWMITNWLMQDFQHFNHKQFTRHQPDVLFQFNFCFLILYFRWNVVDLHVCTLFKCNFMSHINLNLCGKWIYFFFKIMIHCINEL